MRVITASNRLIGQLTAMYLLLFSSFFPLDTTTIDSVHSFVLFSLRNCPHPPPPPTIHTLFTYAKRTTTTTHVVTLLFFIV